MKNARVAISAMTIICAAVALAGSASADPSSGAYTGTMLDGGGTFEEGGKAPFTVNACGPDCIHLTASGPGWDLHRQGNQWVGASEGDTQTLDDRTLVLTIVNASGTKVVIGLAKNA